MKIDPFKDYTRQEQLELELSDLFVDGLRDADGAMLPLLRGIGVTATALQAEEDALPLDMLGRVATRASEITLIGARRYPEDLTEDLQKRNQLKYADLLTTGVAACSEEADFRTFAQWIVLVHQLMRFREQHSNAV